MPTDTEIWNAACERVGLWKRGEVDRQCRSPLRTKTGGCPTCDVAIIVQRGDGWHDYPPVPAPAIGDPTARCAMEDWLTFHDNNPYGVLINCDADGYIVRVLADDDSEEELYDGHGTTIALALANAVLAVPQETQP